MRKTRILSLVCLPLALGCIGQPPVQAQQEMGAREALDAFRQHRVSTAAKFLAQELGPRSAAEVNELADSLVAVAVAVDPHGYTGAEGTLATVALGLAGMSDRAVPYAGAHNRLVRIVEEGSDVGVRASALRELLRLPAKGRALDYIQGVAVSTDELAMTAVRVLADFGETDGLMRLRDLFNAGTVTQPAAAEHLRLIAESQGWVP